MTRLQKMLSQIKTVEELDMLLGLSPHDLFKKLGVSKDREKLIECKLENCEKCALNQDGHCVSNCYSMIRYFNAELPENNDRTPIVKLRDSARNLMKSVVFEGFKQGHSAQTVYRHIDEYIDLLEGIGLFEENELRTFVATDLCDELIESWKKR